MSTEVELGQARYVQAWNGRDDGDARVYQLIPPLVYRHWEGDEPKSTDYVIVSAVPYVGGLSLLSNPNGISETYIFAAHREDGEKQRRFEVTDWCEIEGSFQGGMDHQQALINAGYQLVEVPGQ